MSTPIYSASSTKARDAFTIINEPISSNDLMERAATLACKHLLGSFLFNSISIFCGPGNNGGDGLVIARLLKDLDKDVTVYLLPSKNYSADYKLNLKRLGKKVKTIQLDEKNITKNITSDIIIDALFGSGLSKPLLGLSAKLVRSINSSKAICVSIDIPSGLFTEKQISKGSPVVQADLTLTFSAPKLAFTFAENDKYVGQLKILNIGLHKDFDEKPVAYYLGREDINFQRRNKFAHKGNNGYLTLIAGFENYAGAGVIAACAGMKSGCGYVDIITSKAAQDALLVKQPEIISQLCTNFTISPKTTAIAIGPGLGTSLFAEKILSNVLKLELPFVIDADALNLISASKKLRSSLREGSILTPHLSELQKLIGGDKNNGHDFLERQVKFSKKYKIFIIQKGAYSKLTCPNGDIYINSSGNAGMATAGMGDALTGIIASFLAQGCSPKQAAINGIFIHGYAADIQAKNVGEIGLLASDVIALLPKTINEF